MSIKCALVELVPQPSLSIRAVTTAQDLPVIVANGFGKIMQYLKEFKQHTAGRPYAKYYNLDLRNLMWNLAFLFNNVLAAGIISEPVKPLKAKRLPVYILAPIVT